VQGAGESPNIPEGVWLEKRRGRGKKGKGRLRVHKGRLKMACL